MDDQATDANFRVTAGELCQLIERPEAEKNDVAEQSKGDYAESKGRGYQYYH